MDKYLISIDQGTSSCRALLINLNGEIIYQSQKEFTQFFPKSGWVEHDANEIWDTQFCVLENVINDSEVALESIVGIGITNQRETTVVWNKETGEPISKAIVWQDRRTAAFCEKLKNQDLEEYVKTRTGLVIDSYFSGTKINWILENVEGAKSLSESGNLLFGTIDTWLIYKLTEGKKHVTDFTNASRTMLFDITSLSWDDKLCESMNVPKQMLPSVQASSSHFGDFVYKGHTIPICGVAGDQQAALFGQGCFYKGMAKNTYGTGCFMLMNIGEDFLASQSGLLTTICCNEKGETAYALEGSIFVAGSAIQWLRDGLKIIDDSSETEGMAMAVKDNNDVVVVPAFVGLGAPYWDMYARGAIFGLTRATTQNDIVKATLDALAFQTKDVLDAMIIDSNVALKKLMVDGGAVSNNYLMQFQADMLQVDVVRPLEIETTALGAAYLAGLYLDLWTAESIDEMRKVDRCFNSQMAEEKRNLIYKQWKKAVNKSMGWIDKENG